MAEFVEEHFRTAREFLDALRLSNPNWADRSRNAGITDYAWDRNWIFRGQSSAKWSLLPKVWRNHADNHDLSVNALLNMAQEVQKSPDLEHIIPPDIMDQLDISEKVREDIKQCLICAFAELRLVHEFADQADQLGFDIKRLPEWTKAYQKFSLRYCLDLIRTLNSPSPKFKKFENGTPKYHRDVRLKLWKNPIVALAQHHGVATRLLDWTHNPLTAAFFAAAGAAKEFDNGDNIVVYAVHKSLLDKSDLSIVEVPSSNNDFLRSQAGLFTFYVKGDDFRIRHGDYPSFEEAMSPIVKKKSPIPRKLQLPTAQAPELMRLLYLERVSHAHLMPTLDHVAEAVNVKITLAAKQTNR